MLSISKATIEASIKNIREDGKKLDTYIKTYGEKRRFRNQREANYLNQISAFGMDSY